ALYPPPRLSGQSSGRHDRRSTIGSAAVRRPAPRHRLRTGASADRRIHGAWRHDDYSLRRNRVPVWLNASLQELTVAAGRVCRAVLSVEGNPRRVVVRRGIVLATGGFGGSVDRLNDYVRPPLAHAVAFAGATGDGIRMARAVGASVEKDHASPAFWTPVSATAWLDGGCGAFPHLSLDRAKPGLVAVNAAGRRFVDE